MAEQRRQVLLFCVNDVYEIDHFGRLKVFIERTLEERRPALHHVTLAGDFLSPSVLSSIDKGRTKIKLLNLVGFTRICLGNHEFDLSTATMIQRIAALNARVVNSNIRSIPGTVPDLIDTVEFLSPAGEPIHCKIGWLGFCTEKTKRLCNNVPYAITIDPIAEAAPREITRLRKSGVDFIITMTHQDMPLDRQLAEKEDTNLIIGGHEHVELIERVHNDNYNRDIWIGKFGSDATEVGVISITIELNQDNKFDFTVDISTFDITDESLPTDPLVEETIKQAHQIVAYVETKKLVNIPLQNLGVRDHPTSFASFLLSKVRDYHHVDAVLLPAGIMKGKRDYPEGFRIVDLHKEFRWDEFILVQMPGSVLEQVVVQSRTRGPDWKGFLHTDDGIVVIPNPQVSKPSLLSNVSLHAHTSWSSEVNKMEPRNDENNVCSSSDTSLANSKPEFIMTHVAGRPISKKKIYTVLLSRSAKDEANGSLYNKALYEYIVKMRKSRSRKKMHHNSQSGSKRHHHHERPTVVESIIASLITKNWKEIFGPVTFEQIDSQNQGAISRDQLLSHLKDESLATAVMMVADTNMSGTIDRHEWEKKSQDEHEHTLSRKRAAARLRREPLLATSPP